MKKKCIANDSFELIFNNLPISIIVFDKVGKILFVNSNFLKKYKFFKKDVVGKMISEFINIDFFDFVTNLREFVTFNVSFFDKDKFEIVSEVSLLNGESESEECIAISIKHIRSELERFSEFNVYNSKFRATLEKTRFNISYFNLKTLEMKSLNPKSMSLLNSDTTFEKWLTKIHPDDVEKLQDAHMKYKNGFEVTTEYRIKEKEDSSYIWLKTHGEIIDWEEGFPVILAISEDITEKKQIEIEIKKKNEDLILLNKKLEDSRGSMIEVVGKISNELKNPLNIISKSIDELSNKGFSHSNTISIEIIRNSVKTLKEITQNIANISKIDFEIFRLNQKPFLLEETFNYFKEIIDIKAKEHDLKLKLSISDASNKWIVGDEEKLKIIVTNIIENAFKISKNNYLDFEILLKEENTKCSISIKVVNFIWKSLEEVETFFNNSFSFNHNNFDDSIINRGFGLSLTRELIQLMNGKILFLSDEKNAISFNLDLNFDKYDEVKDNMDAVITFIKDKKISILGIEDNLLNQEMLEIVISEMNINYYSGKNEKEIIKVFESSSVNIDLILLSLDLLNLESFELLKKLREKYKICRNVPIIAMSSYPTTEIEEKMKAFGIDEFIIKPFVLFELQQKIIKLI